MSQCKLGPGPPDGDIRAALEAALNEAEIKAHKNLAIYKFSNFGYWASIWVHLNRIGQFHRPNPFSVYVEIAKKKGGEKHENPMESQGSD